MKWFDTYKSNTLAGSGNQFFFKLENNEPRTGRIYYKVFAGGRYTYSLLFSNIMDSTYFDGAVSHCNLLCEEWEILRASLGVCHDCSENVAGEVKTFHPLTFQGSFSKTVMPGEFFTTDGVELEVAKDSYLCLEIEFRGGQIPCNEESILPMFVKENGKWIPSKHVPCPGMIGCNRDVRAGIGFLGDSITQGIGTAVNSYLHWNALVAETIGPDYSYWNLGLGFGRASDAASDGAWLFKAKQMDFVILCYGVNDVCQGRTEEQIQGDLLKIVLELKKAGVKVMVQTLPPFDLQGDALEKWIHINEFIRHELVKEADAVFDVVPLLITGPEKEGKARYNGHPNEEGCKVWAEALIPVLKEFL